MPRGSVDDLVHAPNCDISLRQRLQFAKDCAMGMNWLHSQKPIFLHLDLKPANLLVDWNWTVKVADFGMSQIKSANDSGGGVVGSPFYMGTLAGTVVGLMC
jgi:serine/threonine protein kinase